MIDYDESLLDYQEMLYMEEIKAYIKILERNIKAKKELGKLVRDK